jgi:serine/threonine protein kinase
MTGEPSSSSSRRRAVPPGIPGPGTIVADKYRIERVLGVGGMGAVLAARHLELDEPVAIKMLLPHVPAHGEPVARFLREARAAIKIRNEHVVRVLDVARLEGGAPYIVMEYLDGCDLGQLVEQRGPLPFEEAIDYVLQACEAVGAAHALGIVHRDLKPANLFVTRAGDGRPSVKVLDFGISKITEPQNGNTPVLTNTETIMGTPCFMSPEQLRSTRDVDARTDIWSIGAILYAIITGGPPYDGESNADVSAKIIRDPPPPLSATREDAPDGLEGVVSKCLQKDPADRYADVGELAQALAAVDARDSMRASAARVVRLANAVAPTLSTTDREMTAKATPAAMAAITPAGPTRTASSWGETSDEVRPPAAPPSRRRALVIGAGVLVAVSLGLVGAVRLWPGAKAATSTTASTSNATAATATATVIPAAAQSTAEALSASGSPGASAPPSASAKPPPVPPRASSSSSKPAPSSSKSGSGLFNGRN